MHIMLGTQNMHASTQNVNVSNFQLDLSLALRFAVLNLNNYFPDHDIFFPEFAV